VATARTLQRVQATCVKPALPTYVAWPPQNAQVVSASTRYRCVGEGSVPQPRILQQLRCHSSRRRLQSQPTLQAGSTSLAERTFENIRRCLVQAIAILYSTDPTNPSCVRFRQMEWGEMRGKPTQMSTYPPFVKIERFDRNMNETPFGT
jgi:hypothetical protein